MMVIETYRQFESVRRELDLIAMEIDRTWKNPNNTSVPDDETVLKIFAEHRLAERAKNLNEIYMEYLLMWNEAQRDIERQEMREWIAMHEQQ